MNDKNLRWVDGIRPHPLRSPRYLSHFFLACLWLLLATGAASAVPASSEAAVPVLAGASIAQEPDALIEQRFGGVAKDIEHLDQRIDDQSGRFGDLQTVLAAFALILTVLVFFFSVRSTSEARAVARDTTNAWINGEGKERLQGMVGDHIREVEDRVLNKLKILEEEIDGLQAEKRRLMKNLESGMYSRAPRMDGAEPHEPAKDPGEGINDVKAEFNVSGMEPEVAGPAKDSLKPAIPGLDVPPRETGVPCEGPAPSPAAARPDDDAETRPAAQPPVHDSYEPVIGAPFQKSTNGDGQPVRPMVSRGDDDPDICKGIEAQGVKDLEQAVEHFNKARKSSPNFYARVMACYQLGRTWYFISRNALEKEEKGRYEHARTQSLQAFDECGKLLEDWPAEDRENRELLAYRMALRRWCDGLLREADDPQAALAAYAAIIAEYGSETSEEARWQLANTSNLKAALLARVGAADDEILAAYREAEQWLVSVEPQQPSYAVLFDELHGEVLEAWRDHFFRQERWTECLDICKKSIDLFEEHSNPRLRAVAMISYFRAAHAMREARMDVSKSEIMQLYRRVISLGTAIEAALADTANPLRRSHLPYLLSRMSVSHRELALLLTDPSAAIAEYGSAIDCALRSGRITRMYGSEVSDDEWLGRLYKERADLYSQGNIGNAPLALSDLDDVVGIDERVVETSESDEAKDRNLRQLMADLRKRADLHLAMGEFAAAIADMSVVVDRAKDLLQIADDDETRYLLAAAYVSRASAQANNANVPEAERDYGDAIEILRNIISSGKDSETRLNSQHFLVRCYVARGDMYRRQGSAEALQDLTAAIEQGNLCLQTINGEKDPERYKSLREDLAGAYAMRAAAQQSTAQWVSAQEDIWSATQLVPSIKIPDSPILPSDRLTAQYDKYSQKAEKVLEHEVVAVAADDAKDIIRTVKSTLRMLRGLGELEELMEVVSVGPVCCYPGWLLVNLHAEDAERVGTGQLLWSRNQIALLNGESGVFHQLNARGQLQIDNENEAGVYLKLFNNNVRTGESNFFVVESFSELRSRDRSPSELDQKSLRSLIKPVVIQREGHCWNGVATLVYQDRKNERIVLYEARYAVNPSGFIQMKDEKELVDNLALEVVEFDGLVCWRQKA